METTWIVYNSKGYFIYGIFFIRSFSPQKQDFITLEKKRWKAGPYTSLQEAERIKGLYDEYLLSKANGTPSPTEAPTPVRE